MHPPILFVFDRQNAGRTADIIGHGASAYFIPFPDKHDPKRRILLDAPGDHCLIPLLENMKLHREFRKEDETQREKGQIIRGRWHFRGHDIQSFSRYPFRSSVRSARAQRSRPGWRPYTTGSWAE